MIQWPQLVSAREYTRAAWVVRDSRKPLNPWVALYDASRVLTKPCQAPELQVALYGGYHVSAYVGHRTVCNDQEAEALDIAAELAEQRP